MSRFLLSLSTSVFLTFGFSLVYAESIDSYNLTLKDHQFEPRQIEIPAHKKVKLTIKNLDHAPEEFDSDDLHREKVITSGNEGVVFIGPLDAGTYKFKGEYNPLTAQGVVIVK
jgi:hypothetical protein